MYYTLPKIWMGRIQKYWDKIMPTGFPKSSSEFSFKFDTEEIKSAVESMEVGLDSEDSIIKTLIPEGTVISGYTGTYDVKGEAGKLTLLSPESVDPDSNILAVHYVAESEEWVVIEDAHIIDGYVWGTLDSFSPVAIFEYKKDIHEIEIDDINDFKIYNKIVVCEGNTVIITEEDGAVQIKSSTGKTINLDSKTLIIGGSADGTPIKKTSITVKDVNNSNIVNKIVIGSFYFDLEKCTTLESGNLFIVNSKVGCFTGSWGSVRTKEININIDNVVTSWFGLGESIVNGKNLNDSNPSFASLFWLKKANINCKKFRTSIAFGGGNCGYTYVDDSEANYDDCNIDYLINGGSNGITNNSKITVNNSKLYVFQTVNRGTVEYAKAKFVNSKVSNLFVGADATDNTVTGTTGKIRIDINAGEGSYNIKNGVEAGKPLTAEQISEIVDAVKVSRNTTVKISDEYKKLLGSKYVVK